MTNSAPPAAHVLTDSYWLGERWDTLSLFKAVNSLSLCEYSPRPGFRSCDLTLVTLGSGEAFLEDTYGDAIGEKFAWNPRQYVASPPLMFPDNRAAILEGIRILSRITGRPEIWFSHFTRTWPFVSREQLSTSRQ